MTESFLYRVIFEFLSPDPLIREPGVEEKVFKKFFSEYVNEESIKERPDNTFHIALSVAKNPLVSVIVPTYNRTDMLVEALNSILHQTFRDFEIIVVNDAGTDAEKIIVDLNRENNITYIRHSSNRGLAASRNTGIKAAGGKYIAYLDDDDVYYPVHLETLVMALEGSDYKVAYTDAYRVHQRKENVKYVTRKRDLPYSHDFHYDQILVQNFIPVICFMHEKSCLDKTGLFDESLKVFEDWDLWIRISRIFKLIHIKKVTAEFKWRMDGSTMTSEKGWAAFARTGRLLHERYREYSKDKPHVLEAQKLQYIKDAFDILGISSPESESGLKNRIKVANRLITEKKFAEAISAYTSLTRIYPDIDAFYPVLCDLYLTTERTDIPGDWIVKAIKYDTSFNETFKEIASKLISADRYEEAEKILSAVLEANPDNQEALKKLQAVHSKGEIKKDWGLHSGERQTAESLEGIRRDHVNRYEYIVNFINRHRNGTGEIRILDCFCGNGYGSYILAGDIEHSSIDAMDGSAEAISFARQHFSSDRIDYRQSIFPYPVETESRYDYIVAVESIEHVEDDLSFMMYLFGRLKEGGVLFLSFPNKHKLDLAKNPNHYHVRHYDVSDIKNLLHRGGNNIQIDESYGQDVYVVDESGIIRGLMEECDMVLSKDHEGQFLMLTLKKPVKI
jgi:glycosyltransferase involved in cell wall biosynthesis/2-polyprenyl-3-methyl-5-hydroxy-6-metoxy-1,4-benzoquinol methylase